MATAPDNSNLDRIRLANALRNMNRGSGDTAFGDPSNRRRPDGNPVRRVDNTIPATTPSRPAGSSVRQLQNRRPQSDSPKPNTGTASDQARATEFGTDVLTEESRRQANEAAEAMIPSLVERFLAMESANKRTRNQGASAGDQRMMRSSIDEGGRPSAGFREQTLPPMAGGEDWRTGYRHRGNPLDHQLAAYAAAIADKDYMRADFNSPYAAEIRDISYTGDPIDNTEYFHTQDSYYGPDYDPSQHRYLSALTNRPSYFSSRLSDGPTLYNWDNTFGREHFPAPPIGSQFGPYTPFGIPNANNSFAGQPITLGTPDGYYNPIARRDLPTVQQINEGRRAAAEIANRYYDRAHAAGPSYMGGY